MPKRLTQEEFLSRYRESDIKPTGSYTGKRGMCSFMHVSLGCTFSIEAGTSMKEPNRCFVCNPKDMSRSHSSTATTKLAIEELSKRFYFEKLPTLLDVKTNLKCLECGYEWTTTVLTAIKGTCPSCLKDRYRNDYLIKTEDYAKRVASDTEGEYTLEGEYNGVMNKTTFKHNLCGTYYEATPHKFNSGRRCPTCNTGIRRGTSSEGSRGERMIRKILQASGVVFKEQVSFSDLKDVNKLSYDFFIPDISTLIEFQGIQHYKETLLSGSNEGFSKQVRHDNMKRDYASKNGLKLIEIPYTAYSIDMVKSYLKDII